MPYMETTTITRLRTTLPTDYDTRRAVACAAAGSTPRFGSGAIDGVVKTIHACQDLGAPRCGPMENWGAYGGPVACTSFDAIFARTTRGLTHAAFAAIPMLYDDDPGMLPLPRSGSRKSRYHLASCNAAPDPKTAWQWLTGPRGRQFGDDSRNMHWRWVEDETRVLRSADHVIDVPWATTVDWDGPELRSPYKEVTQGSDIISDMLDHRVLAASVVVEHVS